MLFSFHFASAQVEEGNDTSGVVVSAPDVAVDTATATTEILTLRNVPDSAIHRLKTMKEFAYANDPSYWKKKKKETSRDLSGFWDLFQYILIAVFVLVVLYLIINLIAKNNIVVFRSNKKWKEEGGDEEIFEESDLSNMIALAEQNNEFRLAARYRYLKLLQELNSRQLIRMHSKLTNWDYVRQLASHPLNARFRYLTLAYEYVWYGEFQPSFQQYEVLRKKFETFLS